MSRRKISRFREIRTVALAALVAAGCGIDTYDAEEKVAHLAEQMMKVEVTDVDCPRARRKSGVTFECAVTFAEGGTHRMSLTQIGDRGDILPPTWTKPIISMTLLAGSLAETTRLEQGRVVEADCGRGVREIPEAGFACTLDGRKVTVHVGRDASWRLTDAADPAPP
jgi:hypothetical protein